MVKNLEQIVAPVAKVEEADTQREGNQNWTCPDCAFTFPLLAEGLKEPTYCPACGMRYYADMDENPCSCEMNPESQPMNEEEINQDEMTNVEESKKLSYDNRKNLPNSDFALVVKDGDKTIRMYPIQDEAHVRNALARLGQAKPRETLKKLGVSVESVKHKVLNRAKKLGMTQLVDNHKATSSIEDEAILNLSNTITDLHTQLDNKAKEVDAVKAELEKVTKDKETEVATMKQELERKSQEIATITANLESSPKLSVGDVEAGAQDIWKQKRAKVDEMAFGKKKDKK
jgi:rubrerythrin